MPDPSRFLRACCALLLIPSLASAGTWFVDGNLASGADDGTSWADAFQGPTGVQDALAVATSGDEIWVADGTYLPTDTGARNVSFALANGVTLYGSFAGGEASPAERPPFGTSESVLSGDLAGDDGSLAFGDNSFHLLTTAGTDASAVIDGFVVRGGAATGAGNNDKGAGILCLGSVSPTVRNCRFTSNLCTFGGAHGYVNNGGAPSFTDCIFELGVGGSFGGAFDIAAGGSVRFERCLFRDNTADRGGALEIFSSTGPIVSDCVFTGNTSTGSGGGGALWIGSGGNAKVRNCTIVANTSTVNAVGGLRNQSAGNVTVANCIFWDNVGPAGAQNPGNQVNAATQVDYSLVMGGFGGTGTGNIAGDPLFVDASNGDFRLTAASPAIDAGDSAAVPVDVIVDFDGAPRFADVLAVDDTGTGVAPVVDLGAFERPSQWLGLGHALAGTAGAPKLAMDGPLTGASPVDVALSLAAPNSTAYFVIGLTELAAPFKGGVLVPDADLIVAAPTSPSGELAFGFAWPLGVPGGIATYYQFWVQDAGGPVGLAATQGVQGTTP